MFEFSQRSLDKLNSCEEDLQRVALRAIQISPFDFAITCGLRSRAEQKELVKAGLSKTLMSRHLANQNGKAEALDFAVYIGGKLTWEIGYYRKVAQAFVTAAIELGVQIELGCLWKDFVDGPHIQLKSNG